MSTSRSLDQIQSWLKDFIVAKNICPFAKKPFEENLIQIIEVKNELAKDFIQTIKMMEQQGIENCQSVLLFSEQFPEEFFDFLELSELLDDLLVELALEDEYQVVSFHPKFQFAATGFNDKINWVNRSPVPLFHLLPQKLINLVIKNEEMGIEISKNNEKYLNSLELEQIKKLCGSK